MVVACTARNGTCLNGHAKVVEDDNLRFKKIKIIRLLIIFTTQKLQ